MLIFWDEKLCFHKLEKKGIVGFRDKAIRRAVSLPARSFCYPLISPLQRSWIYRARAWKEVAMTTVCLTGKKGSTFPIPHKGIYPRYLVMEMIRGVRGWCVTEVWRMQRAENSVNKGMTRQVEKVPMGSYFRSLLSSCIISLTPLIMPSKDGGLVCVCGGGGQRGSSQEKMVSPLQTRERKRSFSSRLFTHLPLTSVSLFVSSSSSHFFLLSSGAGKCHTKQHYLPLT